MPTFFGKLLRGATNTILGTAGGSKKYPWEKVKKSDLKEPVYSTSSAPSRSDVDDVKVTTDYGFTDMAKDFLSSYWLYIVAGASAVWALVLSLRPRGGKY